MMTNSMLYNLTNNLNNVSKLNEYADGYRVHRPSDDPIAVGKMLRLKTSIMDNEQYTINTQDAVNHYEVTENTIEGIQDMLKRLKTLGVQAANTATNNPDDLEMINSEVKEIIDSVIKAGNFNYAGKYIFSGYKSDVKLLDKDGNYNIDVTDTDIISPQEVNVFVGQRELMGMSTNGIDVFGSVVDGGVYSTMYTDTSGSNYPEGVSSIQGRFNLREDHSANNLDIIVNGVTYAVDETTLNGATTPLNRDGVLSTFKDATGGGGRLEDVAKVYFDKNYNLVVRAKNPGEDVSQVATPASYMTAKTTEGTTAKKSFIRGAFQIDGPDANYMSANFEVEVDGKTFHIDTSALNGNGFDLRKTDVLKQFRNAQENPPTADKLVNHVDIFFDQTGSLVIKEKDFGSNTLAFNGSNAGFSPSITIGNASTEASVAFSSFPLNDAHILANASEIKSTPIYITLNGDRKRVDIEESAVINDVDSYVAALQTAIDKSFGTNKIVVDSSAGHLAFSTANTLDGEKPSIKIEPVVTKTPSLIHTLRNFSNALTTNDSAALDDFLDLLSAEEDRILATRAKIGAKYNRIKLIEDRNEDNNLAFMETLSNVGGVDMQKAILEFKQFDAVYKASLSISSKIIQPSLVDFLR